MDGTAMFDLSDEEDDEVDFSDGAPPEGYRVGRFVVLRDVEGRLHAVAAGSVAALCETDDGGTLLMLPAGRMLNVPRTLAMVLAWLDGRGA